MALLSCGSEAGVATVASCFQSDEAVNPYLMWPVSHEMHLALHLPSAPGRLVHRQP